MNQSSLPPEITSRIIHTLDQMVCNVPMGSGHILNCVEAKHLLDPTPETQDIWNHQGWADVEEPNKRVMEILDRLIRETSAEPQYLQMCEEAKALIEAHVALGLPEGAGIKQAIDTSTPSRRAGSPHP